MMLNCRDMYMQHELSHQKNLSAILSNETWETIDIHTVPVKYCTNILMVQFWKTARLGMLRQWGKWHRRQMSCSEICKLANYSCKDQSESYRNNVFDDIHVWQWMNLCCARLLYFAAKHITYKLVWCAWREQLTQPRTTCNTDVIKCIKEKYIKQPSLINYLQEHSKY